MAGRDLRRQAREGLTLRSGTHRCKVAVQSNLWLLDDEYCALFQEHRVEIGARLDGPDPPSSSPTALRPSIGWPA